MSLLFLIMYAVSAIACVHVSSKKGRGKIAAFLLGILFGPLGLLIVLVLPRDQLKLEEDELFSGRSAQCFSCGEIVWSGAKKCRHCKADLREHLGADFA